MPLRASVGPAAARFLREALPRGRTLPEAAWSRRHRCVLALLWLHAIGLFAFSLARGYGLPHSLAEGAIVAVFPLADRLLPTGRRARAALASVGLLTASALLVHLSGGVIEAHFHYFVVIAVVALYEDWIPFLIAFGYVVLQHGIFGVLDPAAVYNHAGARDNPWLWAGIHGLFVAGAGAAGIVSWRLNEEIRRHQQEASRAALESEARLSEAQQIAGLGSWWWDLATGEVIWSRELYRQFGLDPRRFDPSTEGYFERVHPDDRPNAEAAVLQALDDGKPFEYQCRVIRSEGDERHMQVHGRVVTDLEGNALRIAGTTQDVSQKHELDRMKDEFTSVVSHELRTPLTSIKASLGLVAGGALGELPEKTRHMIDIAASNSDRLVRLIDDILEIERMESGRVTMNRRSCDVATVIHEATEITQAMADEHQVVLSTTTPAEAIWADPDRVVQTLTNLMSNAVKFSAVGGKVEVTAERDDGEVVFSVRDEGRGIPKDKLEVIFGRFQQVDASDSRQKGGTGLGLAICQAIVTEHGGRIWAQSEPGQGATFRFALPTAAHPQCAGGHEPAAAQLEPAATHVQPADVVGAGSPPPRG